MKRVNVLIIGGTAGARRLAYSLYSIPEICVFYSLSGMTGRHAFSVGGTLLKGGFGGVEGLCQFLTIHRIHVIVDASHSHAQTISAHAYKASHKVGCYYLVLRQSCLKLALPSAIYCDTLDDVVKIFPKGARIFSTLGSQGNYLSHRLTYSRKDIFVLNRQIVPSQRFMHTANQVTIYARPPFSYQQEYQILHYYRIQYLIARDTITTKTMAKFHAAKQLGIRSVFVKKAAVERQSPHNENGNGMYPYPFYHYLQVKNWILQNIAL